MDDGGMDRPVDTRGKKRARLVRFFVYLACAAAAAWFLILHDNKSRTNVGFEKITLAKVRYDVFQDYIAVLGTIEAIQTVYLDATEGGRIEEIYLREGATLNKGDRIMRLSNDNLVLEIANYEAEVARAINDLKSMEVNLENQQHQDRVQQIEYRRDLNELERRVRMNEQLMKRQAITQEDYTQSKENFEAKQKLYNLLSHKIETNTVAYAARIVAAKEMVASMQKNLELNRSRLDKLVVKAPIDGELATLVPELGQVIPYGSRLGTINILDSYKMRADVDEHYLGRVQLKQQASCEFWSKEYPGIVSKVYPEVKDGKFEVDLVFAGNKLPPDLRIGQTSRIRIQLGETEKALLVPRGGFFQSTGGQWIFVLDEKTRIARRRPIMIGRQNPEVYEVLSGLAAGEEVITSGYETFGEMQELVVKAKTADDAAEDGH